LLGVIKPKSFRLRSRLILRVIKPKKFGLRSRLTLKDCKPKGWLALGGVAKLKNPA